jgi:hypothetical protein
MIMMMEIKKKLVSTSQRAHCISITRMGQNGGRVRGTERATDPAYAAASTVAADRTMMIMALKQNRGK